MKRLLPVVVTLILAAAPLRAQNPAPAGGEFRVNSYTTDQQYFPAAAFDRDGDFVVVWSSYRGVTDQTDVMAQRYEASGAPVGTEFVVNLVTNGFQYTNAVGTPVAMRPDGRFVVVWSSAPTGTSEVRAQLFDANGGGQGEFQVDLGMPGDAYYPNVAIAANGTYVVVWAGDVPGNPDIFAVRMDASGRLAPPFQVNTYTTGIQTAPRVAMDGNRGFVVVWQDRAGHDGSGHGVFGQRYDPTGAPIGGEFQVNTYTTGNQYAYSVARAPDGRFVVTWDSTGDGNGFGVFGQRYDAAGAPDGPELLVNTATTGAQIMSSVAVDAHARFVTGWQSTFGDGSGYSVHGQAFEAQGTRQGGEFRANTYTTNSQHAANVASDEVGNFLVTWQSNDQDGNLLGVFAQRYGGLVPRALRVDPFGTRVIEPGESVRLLLTWANFSSAAVMFGAEHTDPEGPPGGVPQITQSIAVYDLQVGATGECTICPDFVFPDPSPRPATHWDGAVTETVVGTSVALHQRKRWLLHVGESFTDVPPANPFYRFVETLLHHSVTGGCTSDLYCPLASTTREQMAVFVLVAKEGVGYAPLACGVPRFTDVPASSPFCPWIEELARRGIASGCSPTTYCPSSPVTREQMAVFVLRASDPLSNPAACAPPNLFADVPETSPYCRWIEELARRGVVTGCGGGNYCPQAAVTREQMAVFISLTFGLQLYGL